MKSIDAGSSPLTLWRGNPATGSWKAERTVTPETKEQWVGIFKKDEPDVDFEVSSRKPGRSAKAGKVKLS